MDLISMFTADAAAKHGHEFSTPAQTPSSMLPPTSNQNARPRFPHNALSFPVRARPNTAVRRRERPQSMKITMAELKEEREPEDEEEELRRIDEKIRSFTIPGAFLESPAGSARNSEERVEEKIGEERSITPLVSPTPLSEQDVGGAASRSISGETSTTGVATETSEARRFASRTKVVYRLGRPVRKKAEKYIRPRCLLQVQDTDARSHGPIFDVVAGSRVNATTKLGKKLRRLRRNKDGTGADDLIIVRSEHNCAEEKDESEDEVDQEHATFKGQEVIGMIQPAEAGLSANITLGETIWQASLDRNGYSYTLENANDAAQRARWYVPKPKRTAALNGSPREFNFVYMRPSTKRHAVIANMSEGHMEICEEYVAPHVPDEVMITDEAMRKLIVVSGMWVYFCEGWSRHYDFQTAVPATNGTALRPGMCRSMSARSGGRKPLREILRSPSRSPAPSYRCAASVSSDTRSREGSHDSAATTAVATPSVTGTVIKRRPISYINIAPAQLESPLPSPAAPERGRRRFSSIGTHMRRFSHHIKTRRDRKESTQADDEVLVTPILTPTGLSTPINHEEHEFHTSLLDTEKETSMVVVSSSDTMVDPEISTPLPHSKFAIYNLPQLPQHQAPYAAMSTATFITAASRPSSSQQQQAAPQIDGTMDQPEGEESVALPHRLGLGDLARQKEVFTQHTRSVSRDSTSSSDGDTPVGGPGWWSDYGKMMLGTRGSVVVPTS